MGAVIPFRDKAEAIALANDTIYGLSGSIWTRDGAKALRVARGRELGPYATDAYTELKTVYYATGGD